MYRCLHGARDTGLCPPLHLQDGNGAEGSDRYDNSKAKYKACAGTWDHSTKFLREEEMRLSWRPSWCQVLGSAETPDGWTRREKEVSMKGAAEARSQGQGIVLKL